MASQAQRSSTITAISTPLGRGGIGVIRLSGDASMTIALSIFKRRGEELTLENIESHKAYYGTVIDPESKEAIDEALLIFMRKPNSYTCEEMVEISLHGSPIVLERVLKLIIEKGASLALPGEFTKRAYLNKRLDLAQAEGVAELINSRSTLEAKLAIRRIKGELSNDIESLKTKLVNVISEFEAEIDFPENVGDDIMFESLKNDIYVIEKGLSELIRSYEKGKIIAGGLRLGIIGAVNVGKSTLFNAILKRNRAITSDKPGTTRDYLSEEFELNGLIIKLFDTAGINLKTEDMIERAGVRKTLEIIEDCDLVLFVVDVTSSLDSFEKEFLNKIDSEQTIVVFNKIDKGKTLDRKKFERYNWVEVSALKGENLDKLEDKILEKLKGSLGEYSGAMILSSLRQKIEIEKAHSKIKDALEGLEKGISLEFLAIDLKEAVSALSRFKGDREFDLNEEVLNNIFSNFCIGK